MKLLLSITLLLKRFGIILRGLGIALCCGLLFFEAIPDLIFNLNVGKTKSYTENQIIESKKEDLPLYLRISDVEPVGEMYVEEMYQKKNEEPTLSAIIYPVYNLKKGFNNINDLKNTPCNIVVKDPDVSETTLKTYFNEKKIIEGKFDQSLIDQETKKILIDGGYKISDNCILLVKGAKFWSSSTCILVILGSGLLGILILLSLLPSSTLHKLFKQEERFVRVK
ncbi:hypothetical protein [Flavobacterium sp. HJJ]|uniref:hypothetical protein n=1 Tax=Flavobacterium sp. HJJ TaxID=2783792 RepID=UPI00188D0484|nr:hypothetical protein [Flavobacterium sp. HJJ]MBF4473787.1 hypothetical protein [Flavobacterium sp. HJJ]